MECFYSIKESNFYVWEQFQIELVFGHQIAMATVERILLALQNEGAGGESLLGSIKIAVMPIVKVFTMCSLGLLMASKYVNILPASGRKLLNGVCMYACVCVCCVYDDAYGMCHQILIHPFVGSCSWCLLSCYLA